jgi:polyhydroxyalkanoate synthesis regulator phasin
MANKSLKWLALLGGVTLGSATMAVAQDSGALLEALVRKGVLNDQEAEDIRADLTRDYASQTSAGKLDISSNITRLRIAGDVRFRYQYDNEIPNASTAGLSGTALTAAQNAIAANDRDRNRYRYRIRLGFQADLGPKWTAALRFETASGATSTNADLGSATDNFSKDTDIAYFGQAYINYKDDGVLGADSIDLRFGKLPHKFFNPGVNGFWIDSDINFEGLAQEIVYSGIGLNDSKLSLRAGQFALNNNAAKRVGRSLPAACKPG